MSQLIELKPSHYAELYRLAMIAEPFRSDMTQEAFSMAMSQREGWAIVQDERIIGCWSYSDFIPGCDITFHCFVDPEFHGLWASRSVLREGFSFPYYKLDLPRVSGFCVIGISDKTGENLKRTGFVEEGIKRQCANIGGKLRDVRWFGMLRSECRWIK